MTPSPEVARPPNFLLIVADDLGYSDISPFGGEINTPVLAQLAKEGVRLTNFHTASACSPTRSMLFSGTDSHLAGLGQMAEFMQSRKELFKDMPGYEGYLNFRVAALSEILQDAGYHTMMSGKWHLGMTKDHAPCSRGFDKSFAFLPGGGNHYAHEPQFDSEESKISILSTKAYWMEGDEFIDPKTDLPPDFYSTTSFTDKMIGFFEERTASEKDKPFFAYLPYTAPHWPLQAPREVIEKYAGMYDDGPIALSKARYRRLVDLGLIKEGTESAPPTLDRKKPWSDMTEEEHKVSARAMETFAAMVEILDENIGRMIDYLNKIGELDRTFVIFMSDNGAEGASLEALPLMGGRKSMGSIIEKYYDNSLENIGNKTSFVWYGPHWASAATAPSRGFKTWVTEGGINCPCVIRYPQFGQDRISHKFTTVMDILPTMLDLANVNGPGKAFRGREVHLPRGKSWVSHLSSPDLQNTTVHNDESHVHGWELFGMRAIRQGDWKAVWIPAPRGNEVWGLFNLDEDPAEQHDRSADKPEILERLVQFWETYVAETGMVMIPGFSKS